jgi:hypothetical protein
VACALVYFTLFRLHDGDPADEETARRLAAERGGCAGQPTHCPFFWPGFSGSWASSSGFVHGAAAPPSTITKTKGVRPSERV